MPQQKRYAVVSPQYYWPQARYFISPQCLTIVHKTSAPPPPTCTPISQRAVNRVYCTDVVFQFDGPFSPSFAEYLISCILFLRFIQMGLVVGFYNCFYLILSLKGV